MANTINVKPGGKRVYAKILQRLRRGSSMTTYARQNSTQRYHPRRMRRCWRVGPGTAADPAVDAGSHLTRPVALGDLAYREDSDEAFICSVAPNSTSAATFIQMHA